MDELLNRVIFHWTPEKAIYLGGYSLLWDARCAGIYIGVGVGLLWHLAFGRTSRHLPPPRVLLVNAVAFFPMFADLFTLWLHLRKPSNDIRLLTGILFGSSFSVYLYPAFVSFCLSAKEENASIDGFPSYIIFQVVCIIAFIQQFPEGSKT